MIAISIFGGLILHDKPFSVMMGALAVRDALDLEYRFLGIRSDCDG